MAKKIVRFLFTALFAGVLLVISRPEGSSQAKTPGDPAGPAGSPVVIGTNLKEASSSQQAVTGTSVFRNPVVPGAVISCYFDHSTANGYVTLFDGRHNSTPSAGYYFSCTNPSMYDFVGCLDNVSGEAACPNSRELWYDNHKGTDYEFSASWHTGATCDPNRFAGITHPIYAPARGQVLMAGYDPSRPANGWHIRLKHDLNGNGNFNDDNFRSIYLHFTANALAVAPGQIVEEGQYLGLGGSTGYSSSPHLHFEVQRSADYFQSTYWSVDPNGWQGAGTDPWPYFNTSLWKGQLSFAYSTFLPFMANAVVECSGCGNLIQNDGFESGHNSWVEDGLQIISRVGDPYLTVVPYSGSWLGWLGGRNNATERLYQDFQVPANATEGVLTYRVNIVTTESDKTGDRMTVNLRRPNGDLIQELDSLDNSFIMASQWVQRSVTIPDFNTLSGQDVRLSFEVSTDASYQTSFYLDTISLETAVP